MVHSHHFEQQLADEWHGYFYTTVEPDPDSKSDSNDPMRECFKIVDGAMATDNDTKDDGNAGATSTTPAARGDPRLLGRRDG